MVCLCFIAEEKKGRRFDLMHVYSQDDYINAAADQLVLAWRINAVDVSLLAKIKIICFQVVVSRGHSYKGEKSNLPLLVFLDFSQLLRSNTDTI